MILEELKEDLDKKYLNKLKDISYQPIFILGLNRAGTSILYKMLKETSYFNPTTVYHIAFYNQLLHNYINKINEKAKTKLNDFIKEQGQKDRGIDRLKYNADFAEEYGFVIGQDAFWNKITPKNIDLFDELCKKIIFISNNSKPILLKNPIDFPNFLYIKKIYPNAKFIFIHRNPIKVLSSTIKALKYIYEKKIPLPTDIFKLYYVIYENPIFLKIVRFCLSDIFPLGLLLFSLYTRNALNYYLRNIKHLENHDYISLKYEDLCENPQENMEKVLDFLGIKNVNVHFSKYINPRKTKIDKGVVKMKKFIYFIMKKYFEKFNYKTKDE